LPSPETTVAMAGSFASFCSSLFIIRFQLFIKRIIQLDYAAVNCFLKELLQKVVLFAKTSDKGLRGKDLGF
jgi:hypothetical protein